MLAKTVGCTFMLAKTGTGIIKEYKETSNSDTYSTSSAWNFCRKLGNGKHDWTMGLVRDGFNGEYTTTAGDSIYLGNDVV